MLAPLAGQRDRRGVNVRVAPFDSIAEEVRPETRLVAVSHVSWITGRVVDCQALAAAGAPVLLDGAQALGAIPVDVRELGCDFYAAAGQKWMCGPNGLGYLYVRGERVRELKPPWPWYGTMADPQHPLDSALREEAGRFDLAVVAPHHSAWALAALDVLEAPGLADGQRHALSLAARLAELLSERGLALAPRGHSTLVSWQADDPPAESERLLAEGIVVRHMPETPWVRASVGRGAAQGSSSAWPRWWADATVGTGTGRPLRGARLRKPGLVGQPSRRSSRAAVVGVPTARLRRRARAPLPVRVRDPRADRPARHVAEPLGVPSQLPRTGRRALRRGRGAAVRRRLGRWLDLARR